MDFNNLIRLANKNEVHSEKKRSTLKPGLPPPSTSKKDSKPVKGINSAAVRAVLAEQERLEKEKIQKLKQKPSASTKEATSAPKAPPSKPCPADDDLDCDLKKLFNKNSKRVPHVPDSSIPNMLEVLKEKEKLRKQKEREEDEERIHKERELLRERGERERERQREEKEKTQHHSSDGSSKHRHKHRDHHSDHKSITSSTSSDNKNNSKSRPGQFKIPKKPPISYDDILALAAKKQGEPETTAPAAPVVNKPVATALKSEPPKRLMTQEEKDRWARINSEEYQNWLKHGGPPPRNLPQTSKGKNSSSLNKDKVSSDSQLDRRKPSREEPVGSGSDKCKVNAKSQSPDQGRTMDRPSAANGQAKANDRSQSNGHVKQNGVRSITSNLPSNQPNRTEAADSRLFESQRKSKPANQPSGLKKDQKSSELNRPVKPSVSQKDLPVKTVVNAKNVDVGRSNPNINKRPQDSQRLKSNGNDTKANNSGPSSTGGGGGCQKEQVMKDFYIQCKKLKESGFLSDSLLKSLENELREKLKSLRKGDSSNANNKPNTSANSSRPSSENNKLAAKPSASHSLQGTSKVMPLNNKVKSSIGVSSNSSSLKKDEKSDSKSVSVWDKICAENRQFRPKLTPAAVKRRLEEHDSEDEDDDEEDEYDEDDDDMDSFIDDGEDVGGTDYSAYIRSMTKYDPTKYDDDFDDPSMETSYAQVLKEEAFSAREGRREDIEDMVMEEEENKRKLMKKKATAKRARLS